MTLVIINETICCMKSNLYKKNKNGFHCTSEKNIGEKCAFCNSKYVRKIYKIDENNLKLVVKRK